VEDHPVFRDGLSKLLNSEDDLIVCGEAGNARQAIKSIIKLKPDLVVVDIGLPGKSGLELIKEIKKMKLSVKLLAVSMYDEAIYAQRVLRAGGDGYVMKQEDPEVIVLAIRDVLAGHIYVSDEVFEADHERQTSAKNGELIERLADSELEVLEGLGQGKTAQEISLQLNLPDEEVNASIDNIRRKLKLKSANALIRYAVCWVEDSRK
jgi:DNA-binding NarL/FixJ family response regulator